MTIAYQYKCPSCGSALSAESVGNCQNCGLQFFSAKSENTSALPDPDNPSWGVGTAVGVWLFSVLLIFAAPLVAAPLWAVWLMLNGKKASSQVFADHGFLILAMTATMIAQLVTLYISYKVVASDKKDFFRSLGWHWHPRFRMLQSVLLTILVIIAAVAVSNLLPNRETDLEKLLKKSMSIRIYIAALAVVTAPFIEEVVYRGVLFSAFRKSLGIWPAVFIVSLIFVGVHLLQYWGGWGVIASLSLLSFSLTLVRAYTGSLLPSYMMHLLFNCINAVVIIAEGIANPK